jgi:NAD(P) transhydrogenase
MGVESWDLIVIGSGPAGEKAAAQAAYFGKKVVLIESEPQLGGAGVNTGTIPSKTLRETALYFSGLRQRGLYGIDYSIKKDITVPDFMYRKDGVVRHLRGLIEANLKRHAITRIQGRATFEDPHTLRITAPEAPDLMATAPVILIATGSYPNWPDNTPQDPTRLYDSDSILDMDRIPQSLAVVGAGVIGCEYATMFRAMGIEVTLVGGQDRLLPFLDYEMGESLHMQMELLGLHVLLSRSVEEVSLGHRDVILRLKGGDEVVVERVLFATGRMGATQGLSLEKAGLSAGPRGHLKVSEHYQTAVPHIYAAGDVIGFPALASTSMEQGRVAVCHAFDIQYKRQVSTLLPMAVYTIPEIAGVGETEESCQAKKIPYCVGRASYEQNGRGQITGDLSGFIKLVFSATDSRLLGVHIMGEMASELVHIGQACLHFGGTIDYFIQTVFNYPTLAEAYKYAAYDGLGNLARAQKEPPPPTPPG